MKQDTIVETAKDIMDDNLGSDIKETIQKDLVYATATSEEIIELILKLDPTFHESSDDGKKLIESNNKSMLWKNFKELSNKK